MTGITKHPVPLSVLDLAALNDTETSADALANTTRLAQQAEALGYTRFWVAEHHNTPFLASTTPPVLIAHLAAKTATIHIGSGGVMLPNHAPLVVAEQFAMLEALYPGRIDLGIGRAPGTDPATAAALRRASAALAVEEFPQHVIDVLGLLGEPRGERGLWERFAATPEPTTMPTVVLLGSSDYSAQLAGQLGLPFAFANHFDNGGTLMALNVYRSHFKPSESLDKPYAIVTANVLTGDSDDQAAFLAGPGMLMIYGIRTGRFLPLMSPQAAAQHPELTAAQRMRSNRIVGAPKSVVAQLEQLARVTDADEIMISTFTHGIAERLSSLELLARAWFEMAEPTKVLPNIATRDHLQAHVCPLALKLLFHAKAFNTIPFKRLADQGNSALPREERFAIPIAGDDGNAKAIVAKLIEEIGFGAVDWANLRDGGKAQEPGTPVYGTLLKVAQARALLKP